MSEVSHYGNASGRDRSWKHQRLSVVRPITIVIQESHSPITSLMYTTAGGPYFILCLSLLCVLQGGKCGGIPHSCYQRTGVT